MLLPKFNLINQDKVSDETWILLGLYILTNIMKCSAITFKSNCKTFCIGN
jgi:hypothetical protein